MATGVQIESLWSGLFNEDAGVLSGGKVYTYVTGTSTAKATYTDSGLTTENTNPIILDSEGRSLAFAASGQYRFVIQDSTGTTLRTIDGLSYTPLQPFELEDGSLTSLSLNWRKDTNTGWYRIGADNIALVLGGVAVWNYAGTTTTVTSGTTNTAHSLTLTDGSSRNLKIASPDLSTGAIVGTTSNHSLLFQTNSVTRWTLDTNGDLKSSGGTNIAFIRFNSTGMATPTYAFTDGGSDGFYLETVNTVALATNGVQRFSCGTTVITAYLPLFLPNGSSVTPSLSFSGATSTGINFDGVNIVIYKNGAEVQSW